MLLAGVTNSEQETHATQLNCDIIIQCQNLKFTLYPYIPCEDCGTIDDVQHHCWDSNMVKRAKKSFLVSSNHSSRGQFQK